MGKLEDFHKKYDVVKRLGKGQFAIVYEVLEKSTKIAYAAKVINKLSCPASSLETELHILQNIKHPNAVAFKEMFNTEDSCILIMELLSGGELFDRISEQGVFTEQLAAKFFTQLLQVVKHLHDKKIVHRDLKPENILLSDSTDNASLKIIDFGVSKFITHDRALNGTCGTLPYMAPEMFTRTSYGRPVDMWALGVILYIILAGLFPYDPDERKFDCPFLSPEFDNISAHAKDLLLKLLEINADKRFTVDQALAHPWLTSAQATAVSVSNLRNMVAKKKFKRAADVIRSGLRLRGIVMKKKLLEAKEHEQAREAAKEKEAAAQQQASESKLATDDVGKVSTELETTDKHLKLALDHLVALAKLDHLPAKLREDLGSAEAVISKLKHELSAQHGHIKTIHTELVAAQQAKSGGNGSSNSANNNNNGSSSNSNNAASDDVPPPLESNGKNSG